MTPKNWTSFMYVLLSSLQFKDKIESGHSFFLVRNKPRVLKHRKCHNLSLEWYFGPLLLHLVSLKVSVQSPFKEQMGKMVNK